ncbi:hypothetical protein BC940DRAFT_296935 [Gongronella butleri]|nr:hypothetical protein BC940DRAFT_296935 [Gongronella butleri]
MLIVMLVDACIDSFGCAPQQKCDVTGCRMGYCKRGCVQSKACTVDKECLPGFCYNGYCKNRSLEGGKCLEQKHCVKESRKRYPVNCVNGTCTENNWRKPNGQPCTGGIQCDSAYCNPDTKLCESADATCENACTSNRMCTGLNYCIKNPPEAIWGKCYPK